MTSLAYTEQIRWRWPRRSPRTPRPIPTFTFKAGMVEGRVIEV